MAEQNDVNGISGGWWVVVAEANTNNIIACRVANGFARSGLSSGTGQVMKKKN